MAKEKEFKIDPSWNGVIKWGGFSLFAAGFVLVLFILSVIILQQDLPPDAEEVLEDPLAPTYLFLLAAIGELFLLPAVLGLYFALKDVKKTNVFMATVLWVVAIPLFLASRGLIISLALISGDYKDASTETEKAAYLASADHAIETQSVLSAMGLIIISVAFIIIGFVMLKGIFGKRIGYLVIISGILSIFAPFAVYLEIPEIISFTGLILSIFWELAVGAKLYKIGTEV